LNNKSFLYKRSIDILLENQFPSGAFSAAPNFPPYQYSWFRDGSFNAYALDITGHPENSEKFHNWCLRTILRYQPKITECISRVEKTNEFPKDLFFHCRFTSEGDEVDGNWGNHQLDGLGIWLWSYKQHLDYLGNKKEHELNVPVLDLAASYLQKMWKFPCSDCWEENETKIHVSSLGAVYAGLMAHSLMCANSISLNAALEIKDFVMEKTNSKGYFQKSLDDPQVDASLLGLAVPYEMADVNSPTFEQTLLRIEQDLVSPEGGVHRYRKDTYYGGGEWIILAAWYGWVKFKLGDFSAAQNQLTWIENQADLQGNLPEQVCHNLLNLKTYPEWIQRWGPSASPLLWSHSMYLILNDIISLHIEKL
jgi:GH15 family glucan-1,4-alpha-glucosidase